MDIVKLKGEYSRDKEKVIEILEREELNTIFLLDRNESTPTISDYIQNSKLDSKYALKFKVAYEVELNFSIEIQKNNKVEAKITNIINLTKLLEYFSKQIESNLKKFNTALAGYRIVLDTEDKQILSDLMQQFIFLGIHVNMMLKKEEKTMQRLEKFKEFFGQISDSVDTCNNQVKEIKIPVELESQKNDILSIFSKIRESLVDSQKKDLNICVMGTKKSGKSVVINCLLGEEYAPTSLELPTPNTCRYLPNKLTEEKYKDNIVLEYKGDKKVFYSSAEIKKHIKEEFEIAKANNRSSLPEMTIYYPTVNNKIASFEIIDTPGPNFGEVGSYANDIEESKKDEIINLQAEEAKKWIEKSDVVIFLMQYGNHLTNDELRFFKQIKNSFESKDKFYSLIVVVNKMDLMYTSEEYKSNIRFLDYIREELQKMKYKGFFIMGTSALRYFYSQCVLDIEGGRSLKTDNFEDFVSNFESLRKKYRGKNDEMTVISYLKTEIDRLNDFHSIDDVILKTLSQYSGVNEMIALTEYIALEKAAQERFKAIISKTDSYYTELKNRIVSARLTELSNKDESLKSLLKDLKEKVNSTGIKKSEEFKKILDSKNPENETDKIAIKRELKDALKYILEKKIELFKEKIAEIEKNNSQEEIIKLKEGKTEFNIEIDISKFIDDIPGMVAKHFVRIKSSFEDKKKSLNEIANKLRTDRNELIVKCNDLLRTNYKIPENDLFVLSEIEFKFEDIIKPDFDNINVDEIKKRLQNIVGQFWGFWGTLGSLIGRTEKTGKHYIDKSRIGGETERFIEEQLEDFDNSLDDSFKKSETKLETAISKNITNSNKQFDGFIGSFNNGIVGDIEKDHIFITLSREFYEKVNELFTTSEFENLWAKVRLED